ncbi:MAG TPA: hypothetical protein VF373_13220 [Prolixibacteraceae bacterium]
MSRIIQTGSLLFSPVSLGKRVFRINGIKGVKRNLRNGAEAGLVNE